MKARSLLACLLLMVGHAAVADLLDPQAVAAQGF